MMGKVIGSLGATALLAWGLAMPGDVIAAEAPPAVSPQKAEEVRSVIERLSDEGLAFPEGTRVDSFSLSDSRVLEIRASFPEEFLDQLRQGAALIDPISHELEENLFHLDVTGFMVLALDEASGEYLPLSVLEPGPDFLAPGADLSGLADYEPLKSEEIKQLPALSAGARPVGSLTNRRTYMNAGHGWYWLPTSSRYAVQRTFIHNNIEDFSNADLVHQYVDAYLYNAGAEVFHVREPDPNPNMVIVDNDDGSPDYVETGTWTTSSLAGFANGHMPYARLDNPFSFGSNRLATATTGAEPTATATWIPTISESGFYNVYVSHAAFTNRSPQAEYIIRHAGGETTYYIDQRRNRFTWIFIGRYYFDEGRDEATGSVTLTNRSSDASHYVSADAVRFGGGRGVIDAGGGGTSGHIRYDEEAVYHLAFSGAPTTVHRRFTSNNDMQNGWSGRGRFAAWLQDESTAHGAPSMPAVFLSHHTNATAAGTARGAISYLQNGYENTVHDRFRRAVHPAMVNSLVQGYGAGFNQNSNPYRSGSYGEANPTNTGGIPVFLGEWLFHDNAADMALYHDPKFRRQMARGIYHGIVDFFASEIGGPTTYLPDPPRNLRARVTGEGEVTLDWDASPTGNRNVVGDPATGYQVHLSTHGRGFPPPVEETTTTSAVLDGLEPGTTYYFKVTAFNAGGVSFPTQTLAARLPEDPAAQHILVVSGFNKTDVATRVSIPWTGGQPLYRQFVYDMNSYDYIVEHARAIDAWGEPLAFDSVEHDAVEAGQISLGNYDAIIWIGGLQAEVSTTDPINDTALRNSTRNQIASYLNNGGRLLMSGAEIGWDLNRLSLGTYAQNTLHFNPGGNAAGYLNAGGTAGAIFEGIENASFAGDGRPYQVATPDIVIPAGGALTAMEYKDSIGDVLVDGFTTLGGWRHPTFSGQSNADPDSTFTIVPTPSRIGGSSGRLHYIWGNDGDYIRLYNSSLPEIPAASDFSIWVHGDNSGNRVAICLRDSDNDLFLSDWVTLDFTGWQEIVWEDIQNNDQNLWIAGASGNGEIDGPIVRFDSIHLERLTQANEGTIHIDEAVYAPIPGEGSSGPSAAIQYEDGNRKVVHMGFPFETINDEETRAELMSRVLEFFELRSGPTAVDSWMIY